MNMLYQNETIAAVVFDADGTLLTFGSSLGAQYAAALAEQDITADPVLLDTRIREVWSAMKDEYLNRHNSYITDADRELSFWRSFVSVVCEQAGCYPITEAAFMAVYKRFARADVRPLRPGVQKLIASLPKHIKPGVISNHDCRVKKVLARSAIGNALAFVLTAEEVGFKKPAPALFVAAAHAFGTPVEQILYIGNDYECDYQGAKGAGMQTILLDDEGRFAEDQSVVRVSDIDSLIEIFGSLQFERMEPYS